MKPTSLKRGDKVECKGRVMTFLNRNRDFRPVVNLLQCDDYRGLRGPDDDGTVTMSDYYLSRNCTPVQ